MQNLPESFMRELFGDSQPSTLELEDAERQYAKMYPEENAKRMPRVVIETVWEINSEPEDEPLLEAGEIVYLVSCRLADIPCGVMVTVQTGTDREYEIAPTFLSIVNQ